MMKKTILMLAALGAALTLSAQQIRTNYRSEGLTHISTEFETCGDFATRVERVGFPDGSTLCLLYVDYYQKTPFTAPKNAKMTVTLTGGKIIRADQIGQDSATKKRLDSGLYLNRLKYAVETADLEAMARGVKSLEVATGWGPDDYIRTNFDDDAFGSLLKRHLEAIGKAAGSTVELTSKAAAYTDQSESILTAAEPLVAQGESRPYYLALSHLYYKNTAGEDIDFALQIGTEDAYPIARESEVVFTLKDGTEITLLQTREDTNFVYLYPTLEQVRALAYGGVRSVRFETEKGTLTDTFPDNGLSEAVNQQYQLLMSLSAL